MSPPTVKTTLNITSTERQAAGKLLMEHSEVVHEKDNSFSGHAVRITNNSDIPACLQIHQITFFQKVYNPHGVQPKIIPRLHDDREYGAGLKLQTLLKDRGMKNTAIFVTRDMGIHLGQRRFLHIEKVARLALNQLQNQL